jgi:hypothetical protein
MGGATPLLPLYAFMAFLGTMSFQWVPVFFNTGKASGVGVGQSYQSRADIESERSCIFTSRRPLAPPSHGQRQLVTSLYFDKYMY